MFFLLTTLASLAPFLSSLGASIPFYNPADFGGSMLNHVENGFGEPLNVIISGASSPEVLTNSGFLNYAKAIGFSEECLGLHLGHAQTANLGDGNGWVDETIELRENFGYPSVGTCLETLIGGNHFRVYRQNGPLANSGALFLAVSLEESVTRSHTISNDGYDQGRDALVAIATGTTTYGGVTYLTTVENLTGLLPPGYHVINHAVVQDGITALLTVRIV